MASSKFGWGTELPEAFFFFRQSLYQNAKTVPQIKPQPLPSQSFLTHYFIVTILFHVLQKERLTVLLDQSQRNIYEHFERIGNVMVEITSAGTSFCKLVHIACT